MRKAPWIAAIVLVACSGSNSSNSSTTPSKAAAPTFSPPAGTYSSAQSVTISSTTAGAIIHCTQDGSPPTAASPTCSSATTVSTTTTLKAIATPAGFTDSDAASATYTIQSGTPQAATPTFSPAGGIYTSTQNVTLATATAGATIHYTIDGSTPSSASPAYSAPITVATTTTIKAIAVASGYDPSPVASATYTINLPTQAATPTFSPVPGDYTSAQSVTLSCSTSGAIIHYTTDGSTPTTASAVYSGAIAVATTTTIKAIAEASGFTVSGVATGTYNILPLTATPTIQPASGSYSSAQNVTISCATAGATIYYTTNGSTPTTSSSVYSGPITVSTTTTVQAIATAPGYATSAVGSATYTFGGSSGMTLSAFCSGLLDAEVQVFVKCYHANPTLASSLLNAYDPCGQFTKEVTAGRVSYDGTNAGACLSVFQALSCTESAGNAFLDAACAGIFTPHVANGGACYNDVDCVGGDCSDSPGTCPGICRSNLAQGAACGPDTANCGPGLECRTAGLSGTCETPSQQGGPCPCAAGFWCDSADTTYPTGVCKQQLTSGTCDPNNVDQCVVGYVCAGTCLPYVGLGGDCSVSPLVCGLGYTCGTAKTCVALPTLGQSCATSFMCLQGYCDMTSFTCLASKQLGDACTAMGSCGPGLECDTTGTHKCIRAYCIAP